MAVNSGLDVLPSEIIFTLSMERHRFLFFSPDKNNLPIAINDEVVILHQKKQQPGVVSRKQKEKRAVIITSHVKD